MSAKRRMSLPLLLSLAILLITAGPAWAAGYIFSVHGIVHEQNGTPIQGATVRLVDMNGLALGTATTGENGTFDFVNVTSGTENCTARITYADDNSFISPSNYFAMFPATGMQEVNITRLKYHDYLPTDPPILATPMDMFTPLPGILGAGIIRALRRRT